MMGKEHEVARIRHELKHAVKVLRRRGLHISAKWAAELLVSVNDQFPGANWPALPEVRLDGIMPDEDEADKIELALSYLHLQDFPRTVHLLRDAKSDQGFFILQYTKYLLGEKRKEEAKLETECLIKRQQVVNCELPKIKRAMSARMQAGNLDGFSYWLYALALKDTGEDNEARTALLQSIQKYPYNWSAWRTLTEMCSNREEYVDKLKALSNRIKDHWMTKFWRADCLIEIQEILSHEYLVGAEALLLDL